MTPRWSQEPQHTSSTTHARAHLLQFSKKHMDPTRLFDLSQSVRDDSPLVCKHTQPQAGWCEHAHQDWSIPDCWERAWLLVQSASLPSHKKQAGLLLLLLLMMMCCHLGTAAPLRQCPQLHSPGGCVPCTRLLDQMGLVCRS